jgi:hypothetical protein
MIYIDNSRLDLVEGLSRNAFTATDGGVRDQALALGLIDEPTWEKGIAGQYRAAEPYGTFCHTLFKGVAPR